MKKSIFFTLCAFFFSAFAMAQGTDLDPSFSAIKAFFLPSLGVSALALWSDTWKHIRMGDWELSVFLNTKLIPFAITHIIAVALYLILSYLPWSKPFIEAMGESTLGSITAGSLVGLASRFVDDFLKKGDA